METSDQISVEVSWAGGLLTVPAETPYERELLADYVGHLTRRHGHVTLHVRNVRWRFDTGPKRGTCDACGRPSEHRHCARMPARRCLSCICEGRHPEPATFPLVPDAAAAPPTYGQPAAS